MSENTSFRNYIISRGKLYYKWRVFNVDELAQSRLSRALTMLNFVAEVKAIEDDDERNAILKLLKTYVPNEQEDFFYDVYNSDSVIWKSIEWWVRLNINDVKALLAISMMNQYYTYLTTDWVTSDMLPYIPYLEEDWVMEWDEDEDDKDDE